MNYKEQSLSGLIHDVDRRRLYLSLLKGAAAFAAVIAFLLFFVGWLSFKYQNNSGAMVTIRLLALGSAVAAAYLLLVRRFGKRPTESQVARFVEERHPGVNERFVSAVEVKDSPGNWSPLIVDRLKSDADSSARDIAVEEIVPRKSLFLWGAGAAAALFLAIGGAFFGPAEVRTGLATLLAPGSEAATNGAAAILVKPGNARVPKNSDQRLLATLNNFYSEPVTIFTRKAGAKDSDWVGQKMEPAKSKQDFQFYIFNIQDTVEYFVEANGIKSATYKLDVADLPYVKQLDLVINFPSYTGLPAKSLEDGGEIAALQGSTVKIIARLTNKAKAARIVLKDGTKIDMALDGEKDFAGTLSVTKNTSYHIELVSVDGDVYNGSNEYDVVLLDDQPPTVSFEKPGRDTKATSVEEVFTEAKAEDDYGVTGLEVFFSVNGGEEKKVNVEQLQREAARSMKATHTFFLEEYGLQPGDFISYYAKARDARREATSDIYFIEVKPFEREFRQSQQPPGAGAQQQQEENALPKRQKELIAATFRIQREEAGYTEAERNENFNTVTLGQEKLRDDTNQLIERIKRRLGDQLNDQGQFAQLVDHLVQATKEMNTAVTELRNKKSKDAMPAEQRSLQQLLRADAIFREIQVTQSQGGQGQGAQRAEELADLFELELDKMKNQYETVQREQQQQASQQEDEAKRKLEELARRQQKQIEEQQRRQQQQQAQNQGGGGGGSSRQQQELIDETRKTARELEKLSRERRDPKLAEMARQLNEAANEMQRAQAAGQSNNQNEAIAQNLRALQKLEDAKEQMQRSGRAANAQSVDDLKRRAEKARSQQQEIGNKVDELARKGQTGDPNSQRERQQLGEQKNQLASDVGNLEKDIDQASRSFGGDKQRVGEQLREAANSLRRNRVSERIRSTKQMLDQGYMDGTKAGDKMIQQNLDEVAQLLDEAQKSASRKSGGEQADEALDRTRKIADGLESLQQRLADAGQRQANGKQNQKGQQGQQSQQGQQQGKQGQQQQAQQQGQQPGQQPGQQQGQGQQGQQGKGQQGQQSAQNSQNNQSRQGQQGQQQGQQQSGQQGQQGQQPGGQQGQPGRQGQQGQQGQQGEQPGQGQSPSGGPGGNNRSNSQTPQQMQPGDLLPGGGPPAPGTRQANAEMRDRLRDLEDLRRAFGKDRELARGMDQAIQALTQLANQQYRDDMQTANLLKTQVVDPLRGIEMELSRRLQARLGKNNLRLSDQGEAPEKYRKLVDEYYKRLSNRAQ